MHSDGFPCCYELDVAQEIQVGFLDWHCHNKSHGFSGIIWITHKNTIPIYQPLPSNLKSRQERLSPAQYSLTYRAESWPKTPVISFQDKRHWLSGLLGFIDFLLSELYQKNAMEYTANTDTMYQGAVSLRLRSSIFSTKHASLGANLPPISFSEMWPRSIN